MDATSCTVTVPVRDVERARRWYARMLERDDADLEPDEGIVEFELAGCWVQLAEGEPGSTDWVLRIGVTDLVAERDRLRALGIDVDEPVEVPGVVVYCDFSDPDGNQLSLYSILAVAGPS
jgi:predicted enzyme related to lactoylglutathione lyase